MLIGDPAPPERARDFCTEDIDERLGQAAYADLEDALAGVDGVDEAVMEDRDRAILRTRDGLDRADLEHLVTRAVERLARR